MSGDENSLLAVERQAIIRRLLEREGVVRNTALKELLGVSPATIRADLRELQNSGVCEIVWGGAISKHAAELHHVELPFDSGDPHHEAKRRIGARAAQLVEVGQTILVDAGTTTVELIRHLPRDLDYLRVVTTGLNIAAAAAQFPQIELVMTGGVLRHLTRSLVGPQVEEALRMFNADWAFLASGGFSVEHGVTSAHILEVEAKRVMIRHAARVVLLADSSKFDKTLALTVVPLSEIHVIITDDQLADEHAAKLKAAGVEVIRV